MPSPIVRTELLRAARRGRHHHLRHLYAAALALEAGLLLLLCVSVANPVLPRATPPPPREAVAGLLTDGLAWLVVQQLAVMLLAAPAFTAGAVSDEKATGTLQYLMASPLTAREIVLGKWLALVVQLLVLGAPAVPLLAFVGVLAGLGGDAIVALVVQPVAPLAAVVAAGLLASVWSRHTAQAMTRLYGWLAAAAAAALLGGPGWVGPLPLWRACLDGDAPWRALATFSAGWAAAAGLCLGVAAWRLRPAFRRQLSAAPGALGAVAPPRPAVGTQPLRWKERHLGRIEALAVLGLVPRPLRVAGVFVLTALGWLAAFLVPSPVVTLATLELGVATLAGVLAAVRCAGSVSGERERQTWEPLLLTPLSTEQVLRGKLWGTLDAARPYLLAHALAAVPLGALASPAAAVAVVLVWLAAWVGMYFAAAVGLECSSRPQASWLALLAALVGCFRDVALRFVLLSLPAGVLAGTAVLWAADVMGWTPQPPPFLFGFVPVAFVVTTALLLAEAERQLEKARDRIDHEERGRAGPDLLRRDRR